MLTLMSTCSHPGCQCELETRYVFNGDRAYCSAHCADGVGCAHEACNCGRANPEPPGFTSFIQGAVRHLQKPKPHAK